MEFSVAALQGMVTRFSGYATLETGFQLVVIAVALLVGMTVHGMSDRRLSARLERGGLSMPHDFLLRMVRRLVFPLSTLLVVLAGYPLFPLFDYPNALLGIAARLLAALAVIRLLVYALRVGFAQGPVLHAWERVISTTLWGIVALQLVGWLQPLINGMDKLGIQVGDSYVSLLMVVKLVLLSALYLLLAFWISGLVEQRMRTSRHINASLRVGLAKILKFALITLAIIMALTEAGLNLASLTVLGGAIGIGIGFGLQ